MEVLDKLFPPEILVYILSFLPPEDLRIIHDFVCKDWFSNGLYQPAWKEIYFAYTLRNNIKHWCVFKSYGETLVALARTIKCFGCGQITQVYRDKLTKMVGCRQCHQIHFPKKKLNRTIVSKRGWKGITLKNLEKFPHNIILNYKKGIQLEFLSHHLNHALVLVGSC